MMITMLCYRTLPGKNYSQKNFKRRLRHEVGEAKAVEGEAEAIQKLPLSHPWFQPPWPTFTCLEFQHFFSFY